MSTEEVCLTIVSIFLSGVVASIISHIVNIKFQNRFYKINLVKSIFGKIHLISNGYIGSNQNELTELLNQAYIIFNESKDVVSSLKEFKIKNTNENFIQIITSMCIATGIKHQKLDDTFIINPFIISKSS